MQIKSEKSLGVSDFSLIDDWTIDEFKIILSPLRGTIDWRLKEIDDWTIDEVRLIDDLVNCTI